MISKGPSLVFGASGEQGRVVVEGLVDTGYSPVYAFTRLKHDTYLTDAIGAKLITGDLENPDDVRIALRQTGAQTIYLVTTTALPTEIGQTTGFSAAATAEFQAIVKFFHLLKAVYDEDKLPRHVVLSTRDNVQEVTRKNFEETGDIWIDPLDDGSIVPHYSAKGKGAQYALRYLDDIGDLKLTCLALPFMYSNFLGFFCPLPNEGRTQWVLSASLGEGKVDMMGSADLAAIVPNIFANSDKYDGEIIRLVGERLTIDEVAGAFADLFGKDVIYNPLTPVEVAALPFAAAPAMAQMCQFLGDPRSLQHDLEVSKEVAFPKQLQRFEDWLLTHSDSTAFTQVGLDVDAPDIESVTVFGATSSEGVSVVKGLLADRRKSYRIRATTRHLDSEKAKALQKLDPSRIDLVYADFDNIDSCRAALAGEFSQGVFLATDFYEDAAQDMEAEEQHAKNVIDACEAAKNVKHVVFSTMESVEEMNQKLNLGLPKVIDSKGKEGTIVQFDAKARAAAYARTKKISVTYILMPCYSEVFFDMIEKRIEQGKEKLVLTIPLKNDAKVMCMSVDELGPAVANIFDSYQVYAGHEIGLVTDFVSIAEVKDLIAEIFLANEKDAMTLETEEVSSDDWIEAKDTYMKDLGQMFAYMSHSDAVKMRRSIAKTMKLVPEARALRQWVEQNRENVAFREKLGLR